MQRNKIIKEKEHDADELLAEISRLKKELKKKTKYGLVWEEKREDVVEFEDLGNKVKLSPVPEAIMRVYRRVFR